MKIDALEDLVVRLREIGDDGYDADLEIAPAVVSEILQDATLVPASPGRFKARLFMAEDVVHVRGQLWIELTVTCGRCTDPITVRVEPRFEFACFPEGSEPTASPDGEVDPSDMESATYSGDEIELAAVIRDEVFLALPMVPECRHSVTGQCADYDRKLPGPDLPISEPGGRLFEALKNVKLDRTN